MKAVILAAGEGMRMRPLTEHIHKSLLKVGDKTLLEHLVDSFPKEVTELILVVGYLKEGIQELLGNFWKGRSVTYVVQDKPLGTMHALLQARHLLNENELFLVAYADDIHGAKGIYNAWYLGVPAILVAEVEDPTKFGVVEIDANQKIIGVEEKPEHPKSNLVSSGVMILDSRIFEYDGAPHTNGERYIMDNLADMVEGGHDVYAVRSSFWVPVGYPEDLQKAEAILKHEGSPADK